MSGAGALARAIGASLAAPVGARLGAVLHARSVTALAASAPDAPDLPEVVPAVLHALARAGLPAARTIVLLGGAEGSALRAAARAWREAWGVPVLVHDPDVSAHFAAGRTSAGLLVELDDELREAEAIVTLASARLGAEVLDAGARCIFPGLASRATRAAFARLAETDGVRARAEALGLAPVDFAFTWLPDGDAPQAWAGPLPALESLLRGRLRRGA